MDASSPFNSSADYSTGVYDVFGRRNSVDDIDYFILDDAEKKIVDEQPHLPSESQSCNRGANAPGSDCDSASQSCISSPKPIYKDTEMGAPEDTKPGMKTDDGSKEVLNTGDRIDAALVRFQRPAVKAYRRRIYSNYDSEGESEVDELYPSDDEDSAAADSSIGMSDNEEREDIANIASPATQPRIVHIRYITRPDGGSTPVQYQLPPTNIPAKRAPPSSGSGSGHKGTGRHVTTDKDTDHGRPIKTDGKFACPAPDCPWTSDSPKDMQRHYRRHMEKQYQCPYCLHRLSRDDSLRRHLRARTMASCRTFVYEKYKVNSLDDVDMQRFKVYPDTELPEFSSGNPEPAGVSRPVGNR
ncbi:uncharacterized protein FIBRA_05128 [Fibroporia radiculosa]|uniref:C2H2-type domain-containing protein n=1 Tax=Fibroporia radiculosa TaxID=599839 RepID=J4IAJ3_9APHY|nr:uncharacterized protein FIBRA_05128 [Fibroporia radiculosa]CCM03011.1 predicted protein [Fibroporia radiculosa]